MNAEIMQQLTIKHMKKIFLFLFLAIAIQSLAQTNEQKVLDRVKQLNAAIFINKDSVALEKLLADKVTYGHSGGKVENRSEMIHGAITNPGTYSNFMMDSAAGFPTGMKWSFLAKPEGVPRYLVVNADESEPGTFKDRYLMEFIPHLLIEGMIVSSFALGSKVSYIYIRGEYAWIIDILEQAIAEAKNNGWLGKNILGSGFDCEIYFHPGAGAYICG